MASGMGYRTLEQGIESVQAGRMTEGARLLRIALKSGELTPDLRAIAYLWLAETQDEVQHKRTCYNEALAAEPNNEHARQRLSALLAAQLPPMPTGQAGQAAGSGRAAGQVAQFLASVSGANGAATAFYVPQTSLLATTRFAVGGMDRVTLALPDRQQAVGQVVRSFTDCDLALIQTSGAAPGSLTVTSLPGVPDDSALTVVSYGGGVQRATQRPTRRAMAAFWIPTTLTRLDDAGGDPIFDERSALVGMMTRNTSRASGHLFGVHISAIIERVNAYLRDAAAHNQPYCTGCGSRSKAGAAGLFYCEVCGAVLAQAQQARRYPIPEAESFYETSRIRCMHCGALAGFHNGRCLRCGRMPVSQ